MLNGGRENGTPPKCHFYYRGQQISVGTPPRRNGVMITSLRRTTPYHPYYLNEQTNLNDLMPNEVSDEMAEFRSDLAETNALLRKIVQNEEKRHEEIQATKREQETIKADVGTLKESRDQMAEKLTRLENRLQSACQIVQDQGKSMNHPTTTNLKPGEHQEGNARATDRGQGKLDTKGSRRTLYKERMNCQFCDKSYGPTWVRRHERKHCKFRPNANPEAQQQCESLAGQKVEVPGVEQEVTLHQVEVPTALGDIPGDEEVFYFELA